MGSQSIVQGIILLRDSQSFSKALVQMEGDDIYPWVRPEMFSKGAHESPYYYENPCISFAATYKNLDDALYCTCLLIKIEHLLKQTDFHFARFSLETEYLGDFDFFWGGKQGSEKEFYAREGLVECERWFFGFGKRNWFGGLEYQKDHDRPADFHYPLSFDEGMVKTFNRFLPEVNQLPLNSVTWFKNYTAHPVWGNSQIDPILVFLKLHGYLQYGYDRERGFYLERLKELVPVSTPYGQLR